MHRCEKPEFVPSSLYPLLNYTLLTSQDDIGGRVEFRVLRHELCTVAKSQNLCRQAIPFVDYTLLTSHDSRWGDSRDQGTTT